MTETNPNEIRTVSPTGGEKGVKPERFDLLPVEALQSIARLYAEGAKKYSKHNWRKGYDWSNSYAALMRHANLFWAGEDIDPETGEPHMAAVAFHAMTLIVFMQEQREFDDRYVPEREQEPMEPDWEQKLISEVKDRYPNAVIHRLPPSEPVNHVDQEVYVPLRPSNLQASQE